MRKLLIKFPSTPVTKDDIISVGNEVAAGCFGTAVDVEADACGLSKAILTIASWSRISRDGKRLAI